MPAAYKYVIGGQGGDNVNNTNTSNTSSKADPDSECRGTSFRRTSYYSYNSTNSDEGINPVPGTPENPTLDSSGNHNNNAASGVRDEAVTMETFQLDIAGAEAFTGSALYIAIRNMDPSAVLEALRRGESVHVRDPDLHFTYLHLLTSIATATSEERLLPVVYQLSNAGIDVDARDVEGHTALELALRGELPTIVSALIRVGADPALKDYKSIVQSLDSPYQLELHDTLDKYGPGLWRAVADNDSGQAQILVYSWCRVNVCDRNGQSLLDMARDVPGMSESLLTILEDMTVTMEFVHAALAGDDQRMLDFLMDSKPCDPYIMDISHQDSSSAPLTPRTLRDTAGAMGHHHVLSLLPEDNLDQDPDVKGYFGGLSLDTITKGGGVVGRRPSAERTGTSGRESPAHGLSKLEKLKGLSLKSFSLGKNTGSSSVGVSPTAPSTTGITRPGTGTKVGPMKAFGPHPGNKPPIPAKPVTTPDVLMHGNTQSQQDDSDKTKLKLDLLNHRSSTGSLDHCNYEQSSLTGSVALRSKSKSQHRSLRETYSYCSDDWSPADDGSDHSGSLDFASDIKSIEHIATPRGQRPSSAHFESASHDFSAPTTSSSMDYTRNWSRSSLKASFNKSRIKTKDIRSKMCVIS